MADMIEAPQVETAEHERAEELKPVDQLKRMFQNAEGAQADARELGRRDRAWYHNYNDDQWTKDEKNVLRSRGQPIVTSNRIKRKVNFLIGHEQRTRSDPRAFPRNPQDTQAAETVTDVLDYVETQTRFDRIASACFEDMAVQGIEAAEVVIEDEEIVINRIEFDKFFYDPRSREKDFSDARYLGFQDWWDLDEALELFPDAKEALEGSLEPAGGGVGDSGFDDKPQDGVFWGDSDRKRVRIAVIYYKISGGRWAYAYYTGGGILREGVSEYLDEDQYPCCPIIAQSAYVDGDNNRYGVVRDMISPQSEINYRKSMSLFLIKNRRLWANDKSIFPNPAQAKAEAAKADGLLIANGRYGEQWGFIDSSAETMGNFELMQAAFAEIEAQGPNAGLQGRGTEGQSGRAIIAQQNAGLTEENSLFDAHNDWKLRIYRAMWARAKQFWTEEKYVRVTDDENAYRFVQVNVFQGVDPMTGQPIVENALAMMDVDIIIEASVDLISLQHEQFEQLAQLAQSGIPIPPDVLIAASQLRNKQELLEKLQQAQQAAQQSQMMQLAIEQAKTQADIENTQADTQYTRARAMNESADAAKTVAEASNPMPQPLGPQG